MAEQFYCFQRSQQILGVNEENNPLTTNTLTPPSLTNPVVFVNVVFMQEI